MLSEREESHLFEVFARTPAGSALGSRGPECAPSPQTHHVQGRCRETGFGVRGDAAPAEGCKGCGAVLPMCPQQCAPVWQGAREGFPWVEAKTPG